MTYSFSQEQNLLSKPIQNIDESVKGNDSQIVKAFEAWSVICSPDQEQNKEGWDAENSTQSNQCRLLQSHSLDQNKKELFIFSFVLNDGDENGFGVMSMPLGMYLAPGISMRIDQQKPFRILYEVCNDTGCHAGFKISSKVLAAFQKGKEAEIKLWRADSKAMVIKSSLEGFSDAYEYFKENHNKKL